MKKNKLPKTQRVSYYDYDNVKTFLAEEQKWSPTQLEIFREMCNDSSNGELATLYLDQMIASPDDYWEGWSEVAQELMNLGFPKTMNYIWCW